jgi:hypothetical protein
VSQALIPFYLIDDLQMGESSKAVIPAIIYGCSFLASILLQVLSTTGLSFKSKCTLLKPFEVLYEIYHSLQCVLIYQFSSTRELLLFWVWENVVWVCGKGLKRGA